MREIVLDTEKMENMENTHKYFKEQFEFPEYYGGNLDALYDCLTEISEDTIVIIPKDAMLQRLGIYSKRIIQVFEDAAKHNANLTLEM